jgi:hypothetical protein
MGILARRWITGQECPTSVSRADKPRPINWLPAASSGQKQVLFVTGPVDLPRLKHFPQRDHLPPLKPVGGSSIPTSDFELTAISW